MRWDVFDTLALLFVLAALAGLALGAAGVGRTEAARSAEPRATVQPGHEHWSSTGAMIR